LVRSRQGIDISALRDNDTPLGGLVDQPEHADHE
jgi:hypothetical protein